MSWTVIGRTIALYAVLALIAAAALTIGGIAFRWVGSGLFGLSTLLLVAGLGNLALRAGWNS